MDGGNELLDRGREGAEVAFRLDTELAGVGLSGASLKGFVLYTLRASVASVTLR